MLSPLSITLSGGTILYFTKQNNNYILESVLVVGLISESFTFFHLSPEDVPQFIFMI